MIGKKLEPFKFWCQKVLPNVYDDSLSYYEYLGKLNEYLNEVIEQINELTEAEENFQTDLSAQWEDYKNGLNDEWLEYKTNLTAEWNEYARNLTQAWNTTKNYIDNYFDNLNVQTEINNKLDNMVTDGTMAVLIDGVISDDIPSTVTQWLTAHVDPVGSAVVVDNTLLIEGAAADSKTVGDEFKNCLRSTGINVNHNNLHGITDIDTVESNTIYSIEGDITPSDVAHLPIYGNGGYLLITESLYSNHIYGRVQFFYSLTGKNDYKRTAKYAGSGVTPEYVYTDWRIIDDIGVQHDTITFDYDHRLQTTSIQLQAGVKYGIYMNNFGTPISVFINGYSSVYKVSTDYEYIEFTPENSGFLNVYDVDRIGGTLNIDIYSGRAKQLFEEKERVYTVGTGKDYTTITGCFKALARDNFKKTIYIDGGTYDIEQEYASNNIPVCPDNVDPVQNYIPYNVFVPTNAHVIGKGNVVMKYEPLPQNVTPHQAYAISTLNVLGSCIVENITLRCKNGRYCLHDDCLDKTVYNGSTHIYKNVTMIKYVSDNESGGTNPLGTAYCTGFGFNPNIHYEMDNCVLVNKANGGVFYGHNRPVINNVRYGVEQSPRIVLKDCVFEKTNTGNSVELHNAQASLQGQTKIETHISNCWANGNIALVESTPNGYQLIIQKSDYNDVYIQDSSNIYSPWIYN